MTMIIGPTVEEKLKTNGMNKFAEEQMKSW